MTTAIRGLLVGLDGCYDSQTHVTNARHVKLYSSTVLEKFRYLEAENTKSWRRERS